jgi:hypothetical protein
MGKFWAWLMTAAAKTWPILWRYWQPMLQEGVREQWEILLPTAERYAIAVEQSLGWRPKSGPAKKEAVFALITKELIEKEYEWAKTIPAKMINKAIEDVMPLLPPPPKAADSSAGNAAAQAPVVAP